MDTGTRDGAETPAADAAALKPIDVPTSDLVEFADTQAAKSIERLEADRDLVLQLGLRGYRGRDWEIFAEALAEYGFQVIRAWTCSGFIFRKCHERGWSLGEVPESLRLKDDAAELAGETVALAIRAFRDNVLIPGRWDPTRGASLKTFFVGQCILQFPNAFRRWAAEQDSMPGDATIIGRELDMRTPRRPIEMLVELHREIESLRALPEDHPKRIKILIAMGYSKKEIAELLNATEKAIEMKIYRDRIKRDHR